MWLRDVFPAACKLQAEFEQITTLSEQLHSEPRTYDAATCMFAIHYFFDKEASLDHLLETVAANLKPGVCHVCCPRQGTNKQCWAMPGPSASQWTCAEQVHPWLCCVHGMCCCDQCAAATVCCCLLFGAGGYFIGCVPDGKRVKAHLQAANGLFEKPHLRLKALSDVRPPSCRRALCVGLVCVCCQHRGLSTCIVRVIDSMAACSVNQLPQF